MTGFELIEKDIKRFTWKHNYYVDVLKLLNEKADDPDHLSGFICDEEDRIKKEMYKIEGEIYSLTCRSGHVFWYKFDSAGHIYTNVR